MKFGILPSSWHEICPSEPVPIYRAPHTGQLWGCLCSSAARFSLKAHVQTLGSTLRTVIFTMDEESCVTSTGQTISDLDLFVHSENT